jgi:hypothetical protein
MAKGKRETAALDILGEELGGTADFSRSFSVEESTPNVHLAYASDDRIRPRPISTFNLVIDTTHPGYSFQKNALIDHTGHVFTEERIPWDALQVSRSRLGRPRRVRGTVAYLSNTDVANFGHWICLTLPLVGVYREHLRIEPDYFYLGQPLRAHHVETLAMLGIGRERIITDAVIRYIDDVKKQDFPNENESY